MKKSIPRMLPSQHEADREANKKLTEDFEIARRKKETDLRRSVDATLKSETGRILWAHIFNLCGYNKTSLTRVAGGDVAPLSTECKEAQRIVYMELRKLATPELLSPVEYQAEFGVPMPTQTKKGDTKNAGS